MKKQFLTSKQGYDIPCINQINHAKKTVIICHGFGSSKDSPTVTALQKELPKHGIGTFSFDFPHHGDSKVDGHFLRMENCLNDIKTVEEYILNEAPHTEILYFGSSFGAYTLLIYLAQYTHTGKNAYLRSCACRMHQILQGFLDTTPFPTVLSDKDSDNDKFIMDTAYDRNFFITRGFLNDLKGHNIYDLYPIDSHKFHMIHGDSDSVAPLKDATCFARQIVAPITILPNAEHRLIEKDQLEQVLLSSTTFFNKNSI